MNVTASPSLPILGLILAAAATLASSALADRQADLVEATAGFEDRAAAKITRHVTNPFPAPFPSDGSPAVGNAAFALAALWNGTDVELANARLVEIRDEALDDTYWAMGLLVRVFHLFNDDSSFLPGRLTPQAHDALLDLFREHVASYSLLEDTGCGGWWVIDDSENHDVMRRSANLLAAAALASDPARAQVPLPDGLLPADHEAAWLAFFAGYLQGRARTGLFIERGSPTYAKYTLQSIFNLRDFAAWAELRAAAEQLLHLYFADAAHESRHGVRGGAKSRSYKDRSSARGQFDSLWRYLHLLAGTRAAVAGTGHPSSLHAATSGYRLPLEILDLVLFPDDMGSFEYVSRSPARGTRTTFPNPVSSFHYFPEFPADLRCWARGTPGHVAGVPTVDPDVRYMQIHSQNRWAGVIFPSSPDARVYAQCVGVDQGGRTAIDELSGVGAGNAMLVGRLSRSTGGPLRVYFADELPREEEGGWVFVRDGGGPGWLAVRPASNTWSWDPPEAVFPLGTWLRPSDGDMPIVFQLALEDEHGGDFEAFKAAVVARRFEWTSSTRFEYEPLDGPVLAWRMDDLLPEVDGVTVQLNPPHSHLSPFLDWPYDGLSGTVTSTPAFGSRPLTIDLDLPALRAGVVAMEAESGLLEPALETLGDATAWGGATVSPREGETTGRITMTVATDVDAPWVPWARLKAPAGTAGEAARVAVGTAPARPLEVPDDGAWTWVRLPTVFLPAGEHDVRVTLARADVILDRLVLASDPCFAHPEEGDTTPVDTDGDGLPDAWMQVHFGHPAAREGSGPDDDPDGDGATHLEEYLAGTDPLDPDDVLLLFVAKVDGGIVARFPTRLAEGPGFVGLTRSYALHASDPAPTGPWSNLPDLAAVEATGGTVELPLPDLPPLIYLRVVPTLR